MIEREFAGTDNHLVSNRAFCVGIAVYALFVGAATMVFGEAMPDQTTGQAWEANSSGTLIFGTRESTDNAGLATTIALTAQTAFSAEEITPVAEPATWFAAALVMSGVGWSQRRRFIRKCARSTPQRRNRIADWLAPILGLSLFVGVINASANLLNVLPETGDAERLAIASSDMAPFSEPFFQDMKMPKLIASENPFAQKPPSGQTSINLSRNHSMIVQGAPGATVVLNLRNFAMSGSATFTLQGTATTNFIINVTQQFSLSDSSKIVLSGGVQWNCVHFNVLGQGNPVLLSGHSSLVGILTANQRTVKMTNHAIVTGEVIANKIVLRDSAQIIQPPIISP
jgi:hypothetical protein